MFQALINIFKPSKPAPVEIKVEDTIKVDQEPVAVVAETAPIVVESTPVDPPVTPLPQTVSQNVAQWPFPNQPPVEKAKAKPVKKQTKPDGKTKSNSKPAPKPVRKTK